MELRVEEVRLGCNVTLDIKELMEYDGHGKCRSVTCYYYDTVARYREQLMTWAKSRNWAVTSDDSYLLIERI